MHSVKEQLFNYIVLCFIKLQILARISSFSLLRSPYNFCSGLRTRKFWQILLILLNISVLISGHVEHDIVHVTTARNLMSLKISGNCLPFASRTHGHVFTSVFTWGPCSSSFYVFVLHFCFVLFVFVLCTGTCSIQKIYAPSSHIFFEWNKCLWSCVLCFYCCQCLWLCILHPPPIKLTATI